MTTVEPPIRDYRQLIAALDSRRKQLGLQLLALDFEAQLQDGYSSKIVCGTRNLGPVSFGAILKALGVELVLKVRNTENEFEPA